MARPRYMLSRGALAWSSRGGQAFFFPRRLTSPRQTKRPGAILCPRCAKKAAGGKVLPPAALSDVETSIVSTSHPPHDQSRARVHLDVGAVVAQVDIGCWLPLRGRKVAA